MTDIQLIKEYDGLQLVSISCKYDVLNKNNHCWLEIGFSSLGFLFHQEISNKLIEDLRPFLNKYYKDSGYINRLQMLLDNVVI